MAVVFVSVEPKNKYPKIITVECRSDGLFQYTAAVLATLHIMGLVLPSETWCQSGAVHHWFERIITGEQSLILEEEMVIMIIIMMIMTVMATEMCSSYPDSWLPESVNTSDGCWCFDVCQLSPSLTGVPLGQQTNLPAPRSSVYHLHIRYRELTISCTCSVYLLTAHIICSPLPYAN